ncbi:hypothetical protein DFJ74DRAFT_775035 [Hyaloraphidium curvatum]|nr:hypothetical protein DFJ74DRAFT_775035 [Hyaloraphidium curvatum]
MHRPRRSAAAFLALILSVSLVAPASAYLEDACFADGDVTMLFQSSITLGCQVNGTNPLCVASNLVSGARTFASTACRGFIHFDAIFFMAQALGFTPEAAYWFAASSNTIDYAQWTPTDSCGTPLEAKWFPPKMRGMMRTATITGSFHRHMGILFGFNRPPTNGLAPAVTDYNSEGMLAQARTWAWGRSNLLCAAGITVPRNGNYFRGTKCLDDGSFIDNTFRPPIEEFIIIGPIPASNANTTLGEQIVDFDCVGDPDCSDPTPATITNITRVRQLGPYMAASPFAKSNTTGQTVPEIWVRYGIYLHELADRSSHYYCNDANASAIYRTRDSKRFGVNWSRDCNFVRHGDEHAWEQALDPGIPVQTWSTLNIFYSELTAFKNYIKPRQPTWFKSSYKALTQAQLVGSKNRKGILVQMAEMKDIVARMDRFMGELAKNGYGQVPGQEKRCPTWKKTPYTPK